ncbi:hypothetical protein [Xenorhabdus koppenhoeferi]|nr:hypothetical protein [Xenorhabdus sp. Vera]
MRIIHIMSSPRWSAPQGVAHKAAPSAVSRSADPRPTQLLL